MNGKAVNCYAKLDSHQTIFQGLVRPPLKQQYGIFELSSPLWFEFKYTTSSCA